MRLKLISVVLVFMFVGIIECYLYERISKYQVGSFISDYLERKGINNCYQRKMGDNWLSLKCLRNEELWTVSLQISPQLYGLYPTTQIRR